MANKIETARLMGDLCENGDYHAAKDEQGHMEGRIRQLEHLLENAEIIEAGDDGGVAAGHRRHHHVRGRRRPTMAERYLVGHMEERTGDLDVMSPSRRSAPRCWAAEGDWVEYQAPNGVLARARC